jgi:hypothetical protein
VNRGRLSQLLSGKEVPEKSNAPEESLEPITVQRV